MHWALATGSGHRFHGDNTSGRPAGLGQRRYGGVTLRERGGGNRLRS